MADSERAMAPQTPSLGQRLAAYCFRLTPLRAGCLATAAAAIIFALAAHGEREWGEAWGLANFLGSLDNRIMDLMFQARGPRPRYDFANTRVVIVDIDERSLRELGQFPWPRNLVAELMRKIAAASPKAIGFDVVFAEEDRTSPIRYLKPLQRFLTAEISEADAAALDNDLIFQEALAEFPAVVLGYSFVADCDRLRRPGDLQALPYREVFYKKMHEAPPGSVCSRIMYRAVVNNAKLKAALVPEGHFNIFPDHDGTTRKIPLFLEMDNELYPALALEMLRLGMADTLTKKERPIRIELTNRWRMQKVPARDESGEWLADEAGQTRWERQRRREIRGVWLGDIFIPTDYRGEMWLNHRGGFNTFP
ncbi:MAG: CHASE2 domain-containing protein, partial [Planctomycetota bacterium]|nr:CHASE2 domain-containing protein [Planctomycetota bacterium]